MFALQTFLALTGAQGILDNVILDNVFLSVIKMNIISALLHSESLRALKFIVLFLV